MLLMMEVLKSLKKNFLQIKLIENKINVGFGKANNHGLKQLQKENIFFSLILIALSVKIHLKI